MKPVYKACLALCLTLSLAACSPDSKKGSESALNSSDVSIWEESHPKVISSRIEPSSPVSGYQELQDLSQQQESMPQDLRQWTLQDFYSENETFLIPDVPYDSSLEMVLLVLGMPSDQRQIEREQTEEMLGYQKTTVYVPPVDLCGLEWEQELIFHDDALFGCRLTCNAPEGQDLTQQYQTLYNDLNALYGLSEAQEIGPVYSEKDKMEKFDKELYHYVEKQKNDVCTTLSLSAFQQKKAVVRLQLEVGLLEEKN